MSKEPGFLGRGWAFPPAFDSFNGGAVMVSGEKSIQQSIRLILSILPGERPMVPDFGCNLHNYAFDRLDLSTATKLEAEVERALLHFEPRINVEKVSAEHGTDPASGVITITIDYVVRATNRRDNLVFPYYRNERTGIPG